MTRRSGCRGGEGILFGWWACGYCNGDWGKGKSKVKSQKAKVKSCFGPQMCAHPLGIARLYRDGNRGASAIRQVCRLSWKRRERSAVKITERTHEKGTTASFSRAEGDYSAPASTGEGTDFGPVR